MMFSQSVGLPVPQELTLIGGMAVVIMALWRKLGQRDQEVRELVERTVKQTEVIERATAALERYSEK